MQGNFSEKIRSIDPAYRKRLEETITGYLHGTYQNVLLMDRQGAFSSMQEPVPDDLRAFWKMAAMQCTTRDEEDRLRFLKFLLAGFCMFVQGLPGHPSRQHAVSWGIRWKSSMGFITARSGRRQTMSMQPSARSARPYRHPGSGISGHRSTQAGTGNRSS